MKNLLLIAAASLMLSGCTTNPPDPIEVPTVPKVETPSKPVIPAERISLSWENTNAKHPERIPWSDFMVKKIESNLAIYDNAEDIADFCPKYKQLDQRLRIKAWGELFVAITYYESGYNPLSWMTETTMKTDPITGVQVKSEGLLQLSYQDIQWAPYCKFDWKKDKDLPLAKRSIMQPITNLDCGMGIFERQLTKKKRITMSSGVYWAVLKINGKYTKIPQIQGRVKKYAPACN